MAKKSLGVSYYKIVQIVFVFSSLVSIVLVVFLFTQNRVSFRNSEAMDRTCPALSPPSPNFCSEGTVISGGTDSNGCQRPPICLTKTKPEASIELVKSGAYLGYNYWQYKHTNYTCGREGNHQFLVLQSGDQYDKRDMFISFRGGGAGMYYNDKYWPTDSYEDLLNFKQKDFTDVFQTRTAGYLLSNFRDDKKWRIVIPSYCSHDFYLGTGQYDEEDGFVRYGDWAITDMFNYLNTNFPTDDIVMYGSSAGSLGAFHHGYNNPKVSGIIMDSFSGDLNYLSQEYSYRKQPYPNTWKITCGSETCFRELADRLSFRLNYDEPHNIIQRGEVETPIYLLWNKNDATYNGRAQKVFSNLTQAILDNNPGGESVNHQTCVPSGVCSIHVLAKYKFPGVEKLVNWINDRAR